jgi:hypothetical protein
MIDLKDFFGDAGGAVIAAIAAAFGYVTKLIVEGLSDRRAMARSRRASLITLQSLLRASKTSFEIQIEHARNLQRLLETNHPGLSRPGDGYDRSFARCFDHFTPEEKELHNIIRGITMSALKPTNEAVQNWLKSDTYFKGQLEKSGPYRELAAKLADLEAHLLLWIAKYDVWIPSHPEHALVFLADEENHGIGFPSGMDGAVQRALEATR